MIEINEKWRNFFMKVAYNAAEMSRDTTKVGCVIVGEDKEILSTGFNDFPMHVKHLEDRMKPENKGFFMCHAESNAIDLAKSSLKGATLFCTHHPCHECVKSMIQKGIKTVYYREEMNTQRWRESVSAAKEMLAEAKISLIQINNADKKIIEDLWQTHRDSGIPIIPYFLESSSAGEETSKIKKYLTPISIISECGLETTVSLSTEKQEAQIHWGSIGHLLEGMEPNVTQPNGTDTEKQQDLFETLECSKKENQT